METAFEVLSPLMPSEALETIDFIEEDESTVLEDLVLYFHQLIKNTVPEEIRELEVYRNTLLYVCVENLGWHSNAKTRKDFLIKCFREAILFANILAVKRKLSEEKQSTLAS